LARAHATDLISVEDARARMLSQILVLGDELADLTDIRGQVLAEDVAAVEDIPPFPNSAMDGYAVRAADIVGASPARPVALRVVAEMAAGAVAARAIGPGEAARIMTGAMLPQGADAVVMIEETDGGREKVAIRRAARAGENVRPQGEGLRAGELALPRGTVIGPPHMGLLAMLGRTRVRVIRRPRVALFSTGDELVPPESRPGPGQIRDSNRVGLSGQVAELGAIPLDLGLAGDDAEQIRALIGRGLEEADCLVTSGGVSVGDVDLTKRVLAEFGPIAALRVAMKPGMPQAFGLAGGKPVFGLPGNPVSAMIVCDQFVRPALRKMAGRTELLRPRLWAAAAEPLTKPAGKTHFLRAIVETRGDRLTARLTGPQGSGILRSMVLANALVILEREVTAVAAGELVPVELLGDPG
jgi:molybdopterin molybdotransferase